MKDPIEVDLKWGAQSHQIAGVAHESAVKVGQSIASTDAAILYDGSEREKIDTHDTHLCLSYGPQTCNYQNTRKKLATWKNFNTSSQFMSYISIGWMIIYSFFENVATTVT